VGSIGSGLSINYQQEIRIDGFPELPEEALSLAVLLSCVIILADYT
jgi:hypothetical protein